MDSEVLMEGWVMKKALTATKNKWAKRWLVLRGQTVAYYSSAKSSSQKNTPKNTLPLSAASTVKRLNYFHVNEIELTARHGKVLYAYTDTIDECDRWAAAIGAVIGMLKRAADAGESP